ncbi:ABC transporter substrate-binding protein [Dongia sp.]|uniref:ABC transporter substrate-binding protein n=1 Tax=Dongia sp. TaxID=1977262 RepID=UPI00375333F7
MMITRRRFGALALSAVSLMAAGAARADGAEPAAVVQSLYDALSQTMKDGEKLGFDGRYQKLEPVIHKVFDITTMCKIAIGGYWTTLTTEKKNAVLLSFDKYTVSTYASRFKADKGVQFKVGETKQVPNDRVLVLSTIVKSDGEPVELNYLFRKGAEGWQVIDVYLAGAISQLTQMRSEFSEPLQKGGVDALIQVLDKKVEQLKQAA